MKNNKRLVILIDIFAVTAIVLGLYLFGAFDRFIDGPKELPKLTEIKP